MDLTSHEEELVTQTFAEIAPEVEKATGLFYERLFEILPETKTMFRDVEKRSEMFHILATAVKSLSYSGMEGPDLKALGGRHVTYEVTLEQFDVVGEVLMWTFEKILGERFTPEARATWQKVYSMMKSSVIQGNYPPPPKEVETTSPQTGQLPQSEDTTTTLAATSPAPQVGQKETPIIGIETRHASAPSAPQTGKLPEDDEQKTQPKAGGSEQPSTDQ